MTRSETVPGTRVRVTSTAGSGLIVDLFAGGGGASTGIYLATGRHPDVAVNHSPAAIAMHTANHPSTRHLCASVWEVDPRETCGRRPVELLWASPDCTHFSRAKGGAPRSPRVRSLAHVVVEWARAVRPVCVMLDADAQANTEAVYRRLLLRGVDVRAARLPPGTDPGELAPEQFYGLLYDNYYLEW